MAQVTRLPGIWLRMMGCLVMATLLCCGKNMVERTVRSPGAVVCVVVRSMVERTVRSPGAVVCVVVRSMVERTVRSPSAV